MELPNRNIERIEKQGRPKFRGMSKAKDMRGWIIGSIQSFVKQGNTEYEFVFREVLNAYNKFHPVQELQVEIPRWKGKSSFEIRETPDRYIIIKHQRPARGEIPVEVRTDVSKEEMSTALACIRSLWKGEPLETKDIALEYCIRMDYRDLLHGDVWKNFFADRAIHNKFTLILNALERMGFITYLGGKTVLK